MENMRQRCMDNDYENNDALLYAAIRNILFHSLGQFIQDGSNIMFETVLNVEKMDTDLTINAENVDLDGGVPNLIVNIPDMKEYSLGQLFYFFEFACGISGYFLGVNPFDQPGVEAYKENMFALLGKPGFEDRKAELEKRL